MSKMTNDEILAQGYAANAAELRRMAKRRRREAETRRREAEECDRQAQNNEAQALRLGWKP